MGRVKVPGLKLIILQTFTWNFGKNTSIVLGLGGEVIENFPPVERFYFPTIDVCRHAIAVNHNI
jgi:hypothetical protein